MMWTCSSLAGFWTGVRSAIERAYVVTLPRDPKVCILGCVSDLGTEQNYKVAIGRLLYVARKLIAMHWIQADPTTY